MPDRAAERTSSAAASRTRAVVLGLLSALTLVVVLALLRSPDGAATSVTLLAAAVLVPLALPLRGLLRHDRRTYAWATLCLTPQFIYGLTELVANPPLRLHAAAMLLLSLALMVALVAYLRLTRPDVNRVQ
jgi:uncharacterized membrane protein